MHMLLIPFCNWCHMFTVLLLWYVCACICPMTLNEPKQSKNTPTALRELE